MSFKEREDMDIGSVRAGITADKVGSQSFILVARKALAIMKQQGQNALAMIGTAVPPVDEGKGKW
jgi:hypothetical protein